ncbi:hypothetical protein CHS0354_034920 [Potamilus streckersoni]|uniref:VWFD domain-containing protein n=1 Tax=Potamilus streckersoni TaxID=2493646 RepID=A0AAE0VUQ6_9BIVA|nr:hypothetical protein CHS0354_034920 [Potamilus streckersoni]
MHIPAVLMLFILGGVTDEDCGGNYTILPDLDRRSRNYAVSGNNEPYVSDRYLTAKWYNVLNNNMPTDSTNLESGSSCGTYYPVWMNGTVPGQGNAVSRNVCIFTFNDICDQQKTIQVKNCTSFMLYYLGPTGSSIGYCFDNLQALPVPVPAPDFKPDFLELHHELTFTSEFNKASNKEYFKPRLTFQCNFTKIKEAGLFYTVFWYVNENYLLKKGPALYSAKKTTDLLESDLTSRGYKLDITIKCGVSASVTPESYLSKTIFSSGFWIGIRVSNFTVFLKEGKTADVHFQTTVPFGCESYKKGGASCSLSIQIYDPSDTYECKKSSISVQNPQLCGVELLGVKYEEFVNGSRYYNTTKMTITTRDRDIYDSGSRTFKLNLVAKGIGVNDIMNNFQLKDITVEVVGQNVWQEKKCHANVDPHMQSFDGSAYENQNVAEFIMYKNKKYKQEVQIKTTGCWSPSATCVCAVSVNAGGDLFVMNLCDKRKFIDFVSCYENIIDVRRPRESPNVYEINMPLGTIVTVSLSPAPTYGSTMNVFITPAIKDVDATEGLCGPLNGNQTDDSTQRNGKLANSWTGFSLSWRINSSESFLNPKYEPEMWEGTSRFCYCPEDHAINNEDPINPVCSSSMFLTCKRRTQQNTEKYGKCVIRSKRSPSSRRREIQRIFDERTEPKEISQSTNLHHISKRSTFEDGYALCSEFFRANCSTAAFEDKLPSVTKDIKNTSLVNCALDYQYIGDTSLANIHCESYRIETEMEIRKNSTFREVHSNVVESFYSATCINNCNGHGDCVNGTCTCHAGYIENDCSVSLDDYPAVDDTYAGGLCRKDSDECCGDLAIYGSGFVKGRTKQKVEVFQIDTNATFQVMETSETNLTVINPFQGEMTVPCGLQNRRSTDAYTEMFIRGVRVSLTNNGINYGSSQLFYVYDPNCQGVLNDTNGYRFKLLEGMCFINNMCYPENLTNPSDSCQRCQPSINPYLWTGECSSSKTNVESSSDHTKTAVAVAVPIGILVVIISTIVIIRCCVHKKIGNDGCFPNQQGNAEYSANLYLSRTSLPSRENTFASQDHLE